LRRGGSEELKTLVVVLLSGEALIALERRFLVVPVEVGSICNVERGLLNACFGGRVLLAGGFKQDDTRNAPKTSDAIELTAVLI
jgi:hypothetical protein